MSMELGGQPPDDSMSAAQSREEIGYALGLLAHLWGYPMRCYRAMAAGIGGSSSRINHLHEFSRPRTARDRRAVRADDVTINAHATLDLTLAPVVLHVPVLAPPRWYLVQIGDWFGDVVLRIGGVGGPKAGDYAIVGPDFQGTVPAGMVRVPMRTRYGVVRLRIFVETEADVSRAVDAQSGFRVAPMADFLSDGLGGPTTCKAAFSSVVSEAPSALMAFDELGQVMRECLPVTADLEDSLVRAFHDIGLSVAKGFEWRGLDEDSVRGLARAALAAEQLIDRRWLSLEETMNGSRYGMADGRSGHDFVLRAALAKNMIGGRLASELIYPSAAVDSAGEPLTGKRKYVLHFARGALPPAHSSPMPSRSVRFWNRREPPPR
ncbi:MAG TPA: DUF1254 domain-containing protein [Gemmatimonadaceae bacterium]|nr:DUF1254 domain-containing protein [Gemmatimonadaceae bacterium]